MTTQLQRQAQMTRDQSIVTEIQYTLQKDLDNFLGILSETIAVTQWVSKADPLYLIHINRLIAQLNLSSSIHYDTQQNCQYNGSEVFLKEQKGVSLKILEEFLQWAKINPVQEIEQLLNDYKNILQTPQVSINIRNLHRTNTNGLRKDQQHNIQKLLEAIAKSDDDYAKIRNGEQVQLGDKQQLFDKVNRRYQIATQKIQIYLNQNTNNKPLQNSQQFLGNPDQQNNNLNYNQNHIQGISNANGIANGGSSIGAHRSQININTNPIYQELYNQHSQLGLTQSQNFTSSNKSENHTNKPLPQVNQNQQKMEYEQLYSREYNNKQLIKYSPETMNIMKTIISIIYNSQHQNQDLQKMFNFIYRLKETKPQVYQELDQLQKIFSPKNNIEFIINHIKECIQKQCQINLTVKDFQNIYKKDEQALIQLISDDFK